MTPVDLVQSFRQLPTRRVEDIVDILGTGAELVYLFCGFTGRVLHGHGSNVEDGRFFEARSEPFSVLESFMFIQQHPKEQVIGVF